MYKYRAEVIRVVGKIGSGYATWLNVDLGFRQWKTIDVKLDQRMKQGDWITMKVKLRKDGKRHIYTGKVLDF